MLYFWLYSNRILTAEVLFNVFKKWGFSYLPHRFRFDHYFLKGIRESYFAPFPPLRINAFKKLSLD
ncbi:hypothetical protein HPHPP16_1508 [Helicobacter pylori Hp P-16]|nr:hypothetical protein HPHPP16_1508 [Helicobacter pylori Hp P-16]